jgi:hypothetical protein
MELEVLAETLAGLAPAELLRLHELTLDALDPTKLPGALDATLDRLAKVDPAVLGDPESVVALHRASARVDALATGATGAFDTSGLWALDGAHTAAAWLATRCRLPGPAARRPVHRARALRELPACARAWSAGELTAAHVDVLAKVRNETTADALARDEQLLVDEARTLGFEHFARAVAYWGQHADPNGVEQTYEERRARRDVFLAKSFDGTFLGSMTLDPIGGAMVSSELERLEELLFESDWADARGRVDREPLLTDLARTPAQRRADALLEMATRSRTAPANGRAPRPLVTVLVGYETLKGRILQLANGSVITPGALLSHLGEADIERAVFGPDDRVAMGKRARLFTGATRRAIELRDRECAHPYCDAPLARCEVDHIQPYSHGGETTQENGQLLCGFHNRLKAARGGLGVTAKQRGKGEQRGTGTERGRPPPEAT